MRKQVFDQFCHFVSLEPKLFSLNMTDSFALMNSPLTPDAQQQLFIASIVDGLFSLCATMVRAALSTLNCAFGMWSCVTAQNCSFECICLYHPLSLS